MNDVSKILVDAFKDVEKAKVPDDLREIAFREAIRLREGREAPRDDMPTPEAKLSPKKGGSSTRGALAQIADRFGVSEAQLSEVFAERDNESRLAIGTRALPGGKAPATKEIALLVVGARQATGEEWTSVNVIRDWCKEYGKYDSANFGKTVAGMDNLFQFSGKGQKREVKMRQPAWEEAGDIVRRIMESE